MPLVPPGVARCPPAGSFHPGSRSAASDVSGVRGGVPPAPPSPAPSPPPPPHESLTGRRSLWPSNVVGAPLDPSPPELPPGPPPVDAAAGSPADPPGPLTIEWSALACSSAWPRTSGVAAASVRNASRSPSDHPSEVAWWARTLRVFSPSFPYFAASPPIDWRVSLGNSVSAALASPTVTGFASALACACSISSSNRALCSSSNGTFLNPVCSACPDAFAWASGGGL